jgi:hypothetical protein
MTKWKVEYIETGSDRKRSTTHTGNLTREEVIEFFGLNGSDIEWYNVTEM